MDKVKQQASPEQRELQRRKKGEKLLAKKAAAREAQNKQFKDHLQRELAFSNESRKKLFEGWENLCVRVKCEQLVEELRQEQQCFGTVVDRKNACINRLLAVRDEIGEIHDKCLQRLGNIIDYYVRLKDFLTAAMFQRYKDDCRKLLMDFRKETAGKQVCTDAQMAMLDASLAELLKTMNQNEKAGRDWMLENDDANKCVQIEKCEILREKKYAEMNALYRQLRTTLGEYFHTVLHPERKENYDRLVYYTQLEQQDIEKRRCQIAVAQLKKSQLEHTLALALIGGRRKRRTQHNYRRLLELKVNLLKEQHQQLEEVHRTRLKLICSFSHRLEELLSKHFSRGEKIAKQAAICSQYETEQDVQFASRWFKERGAEANPDEEQFFDYLFNKINRVQAINIILREETIVLKRENDDLRAKFKSYCKLHKITDQGRLHLCGQEEALQP